ncbi:MAG: hypothetical protein WD852_10465 [Methyloceanibacter sp.]
MVKRKSKPPPGGDQGGGAERIVDLERSLIKSSPSQTQASFAASRRRVRKREWRWHAKQQRESQPRSRFSRIANFRIPEIERLFEQRYRGPVLPDDDAGRDDLILMLHHLAHTRGDVLAKMLAWTRAHAPWLPDATKLAKAIAARCELPTARQLGRRLRLSDAERTALKITTIRPFDVSAAELVARRLRQKIERRRQRRRKQGVRSRAEYEANSLSRLKPWEAEGISRRTWERRRNNGGVSSVTPTKRENPLLLGVRLASRRRQQGEKKKRGGPERGARGSERQRAEAAKPPGVSRKRNGTACQFCRTRGNFDHHEGTERKGL